MPHRSMRALPSIAKALMLAIIACLLASTGALAHAGLVSADPADGSVLAAAPAAVTLTFTEPVSPLAVTLVTAEGQRQDLDTVTSAGERVVIGLPKGLGKGTHLLSWRIASADGHPVAGTLAFSIGAPGLRPQLAAGPDPALATATWVVRAALYALLFVGVGMAVFGATVTPLPKALRRMPLLLSGGGLLLAPIALDLHGLDALGLGLGSLATARPMLAAFATSYGATIIAMVLAFALTVLSQLGEPSRSRGVLVFLAWGAAALAPVLSGHAGTAPPQWLSRPAVVLHMLSLVYWVGALVPLSVLLRAPGDDALTALRRFSRQIPYAVVAVLGGGVALALLQMGPPGPAWQSAYAALLAAKLVLVAALLGLVAFNRLKLTQPALAGGATAARHLRRSIGIEIILVLAIFGLVAGWRFTPPPRVIAELASRPAQVHLHGEAAMADVTLLPGRAGPAELRVWVSDAALGALVPRSIKASFSNPALGIQNLTRSLEPGADGFWRAAVALPSGGAWRIALDVRIDDFTMTRLEGDLELNP